MTDKVVVVADIRVPTGDPNQALTSKAILHQAADAETSVFRVKPGGRIKAHLHNHVWDLFFGVSGDGVIAFHEDGIERMAPMKAGSFCAMPATVVHEVRNLSATDDVVFVLVHAPWAGYDHVPTPLHAAASVQS